MLGALTTESIKGLVERRGMVDYGILVDKQLQLQGKSNSLTDIVVNNLVLLLGGNGNGNGSAKVGEVIDCEAEAPLETLRLLDKAK